jgi:hypothetical protein
MLTYDELFKFLWYEQDVLVNYFLNVNSDFGEVNASYSVLLARELWHT